MYNLETKNYCHRNFSSSRANSHGHSRKLGDSFDDLFIKFFLVTDWNIQVLKGGLWALILNWSPSSHPASSVWKSESLVLRAEESFGLC